MKEEPNKISFKWPFGSLDVSSRAITPLLLAMILAVQSTAAGLLWMHEASARTESQQLHTILLELAKSNQKVAAAQRETTCILALNQAERKQQFFAPGGLCRRLSQSE